MEYGSFQWFEKGELVWWNHIDRGICRLGCSNYWNSGSDGRSIRVLTYLTSTLVNIQFIHILSTNYLHQQPL